MIGWLLAVAWGGGFEVAQQGAATAGTAHAGTALAGRAEGAWFNPAGLADGGGFRLAVGATLAHSRISAAALPDAPEGAWTAETVTPLGTPPYLHASYAQARWAVAVSVGTPFAGGVRWPEAWVGRFESIASRPLFLRGTASFAYRFGPVAISGGVHVDHGGLRVERATDHVDAEGRVTLDVRGTGVGGDASLMAWIGDHATLGATYKSRTALALYGEADFDVPAPFAGRYPDGRVFTPWTLPDRVALAFAWTAPRWGVTVEAGVTVWGVNDALRFDFEQPVTPDTVQENRWRTGAVLRGGGWVQAHRIATLRLGGYVDGVPGAPPDPGYLSPSSPDGTRVGGTLGLGIEAHRFVRIDLYGEGLGVLTRASTSPEQLAASYRGWAVAGGLGLTVLAPPARPRPGRVATPSG